MIESTMESKTPTVDTSRDLVPGEVDLDDDVVAKIATLAVKDVRGLHSLGKARLLPFGNDGTRGVGVEVGKKQVAVDLDAIIEYGHDITQVARAVRQRIAEGIRMMAGREVVEVNIHVIDIKLPEDATANKKSRVE